MSVFGVILVRIFPAFSRILTEYSIQMRENAGKMRIRTTPNTDTFYVVFISRYDKNCKFLEKKVNVSRIQAVCHLTIVFFDLFSVKHKCAKFHCCGTGVTDIDL